MVFPTVQAIRFNTAINPSGFRNIPASGQILDTSITGFLDFGNVNTSTSGAISDTAMSIFRVASLGDASGIYDMRFFLSSATAFNAGNYRFLHKIATHYQGTNFGLTLADLDVPVALPTAQNLICTTPSSQPALSGITDADVSQYIYLAVYADSDVPYKTYGGGGAGSFRYSIVYNFS